MRRPLLLSPLVALVLAACSRTARVAPPAPPPREPVALLVLPDRSRWMPDTTEGAELLSTQPDGTQQLVLQRLRLEQSPSGVLRRARDLLPSSRPAASSMALPDRLGGGYLFVTSSGGSSLWRARAFLSRLTPLTRLSASPVQAVAGPDRILLRAVSSDRVWGVDPDTGSLSSPLPLPEAPRYGAMAFVDAWRGAVQADLRGVLVTRDAGVSWRPLPLAEMPRTIAAEGDLLVLGTGAERQRFDPTTGALVESAATPPSAASASAARPLKPPPTSRPLRVAVEDGWPLLDGTAVAMRQGRVTRVRLEDGEPLESSFAPIEGEESSLCPAVRFGVDVGFVCGASGRGTTIYAYSPPSGVTRVRSFEAPRAVMPSQNGWLVVRGSCAEGEREALQSGSYCIVSPTGATREVLTLGGDVGVERVVALSDGRVAVIEPPRGGANGQVTLVPARNGEALTSVPLQPPEEAPMLRRGLWLDGMYEVEPGELGGWVESSGLLVGVRLKLADGTLTSGPLREGSLLSIAGTRALAAIGSEQLHESLDGGLTWRQVEPLPQLGQGRLQAGLHCGAAGCVIPFERGTWLRVGWGPPVDPLDLDEAPERPAPVLERTLAQPLRLTCELRQTIALKEPAEPAPPPRFSRRFFPVPADATATSGPLPPFLGVAAPAVPAGSAALSEGTASGTPSRLYGWVPRGVAAARAGRWQVRFQDRFDAQHPVRSSALSIAPWRDEQALQEAFGIGNTSVAFHGLGDPGGRALLLSACQGTSCELFGAVDGRPLAPLPQPEGEPLARVFSPSASAVWLDETFFLAHNLGASVQIWRFGPGAPRMLAQLPRVTSFNNLSAQVTLIRRAHSGQLGLLGRGAGQYGRSDQDFFVLPIDPTTGQTGEMIRLGPVDLAWSPTRACSEQDDGWMIETPLAAQPVLRLPPGVRLGDVQARFRVDPASVCVEAMAAHMIEPVREKGGRAPDKTGAPSARAVTLVATTASQRALLSCAPSTTP